jgi:putative transposase
MGIARSTFYDRPDAGADDAVVVAQMKAICDQFETYGYRRVGAELRHRGMVVNAKKVRRLMREHALNPKRHRRFIATTNSNHSYPICPNLATSMTLNGPNQLWVADITYVAITNSFVYLAVILDAWSRRVVGYAISRSIDARVVAAALKAAINAAIHHGAASIIPTVGRNTPPKLIAPSYESTASSLPWAGAAIPMTTPKPRAS